MAAKWFGKDPICDFCHRRPAPWFVDGATFRGPWAIMCPDDFVLNGVGIGTGKGQQYDSKTLEKVDG